MAVKKSKKLDKIIDVTDDELENARIEGEADSAYYDFVFYNEKPTTLEEEEIQVMQLD